MGDKKIDSAVASDPNAFTDFSVPAESTDGGSESVWYDKNWEKYFGYYNSIPELNAAIDAKSTWTVGKGFKADEVTTMLLDSIKGFGRDTFNTIIENLIRTMYIGGDGFAEIIRDDEGNLTNLKPLDPSTVGIITNKKGMITGYAQRSKAGSDRQAKRIEMEKIFHLVRNRVADQIHGTSIIKKLETIILMRNEAMDDWKRVLHRNVDPMMIYHLDTDDPTEIETFKTKTDKARGKGNNMYVPKDAVVPEQMSLAPNASLNPLPWIEALNQYFYQATGGTDIVIGATLNITEADAKIKYLAFQQETEEEQLFVEEQMLAQLNIVLDFEFPASLENELLSDEKKDGPEQAAQPNDTTVTGGEKIAQENTA